MTVNELIQHLQTLVTEHGDLEVTDDYGNPVVKPEYNTEEERCIGLSFSPIGGWVE